MNPVKKFYYTLSFGVLFSVSAYVGILTLQSSIHIKENTGIISASVLYLTAAVLSIVATPVMLIHFGAKWSLIIGEVGFLIYSISNYYPNLPTLVIGGIFGAFGEALIWPAAPVYIDIILKNAWRRRTVEDPTDSIFKKSRSYDHERNVWLGSFYGILQNCLIWGNFISYLALYGARNFQVAKNVDATIHQNVSHCGANFQLNEEDEEEYSKYIPKSNASVYLMLSVFVCIQVFAIFLHSYFLPTVVRENSEYLGKRTSAIIKDTLKQTLSHVNSFDQVMLIFINIYFGFLLSYSRGVFSQAFVSCVLGVQMVGLVMMLYGCGNAFTALMAGHVASRCGLRVIVIFGFFFDIMSYILQLYWIPSFETRYYILGIGTLIGITEGLWQFSVIAMTAMFFEEQQEIAFGAINLWCELAVFLGFLLTPTLAVSDRIYIMIALLVMGCIGFFVVDNRRKRKEELQQTDAMQEARIMNILDEFDQPSTSEDI